MMKLIENNIPSSSRQQSAANSKNDAKILKLLPMGTGQVHGPCNMDIVKLSQFDRICILQVSYPGSF